MLAVERREHISKKIKEERKVYVPRLAKELSVTEETIRRDLEKLEAQGLLTRSYGGATLNEHTVEDLPFLSRCNLMAAEKARIAKLAARLLRDGDTLMMDSSTTGLAFIQEIRSKKDLTIITNSVRIADAFATSDFTLISTGGRLRSRSFALTGTSAIETLQRYFVDHAVISCKGIRSDKGIMESNEEESEIKRVMIQQARNAILLIDHSKFDKSAFVHTANIDRLSALVTDKAPSDEWQNLLEESNVRLLY